METGPTTNSFIDGWAIEYTKRGITRWLNNNNGFTINVNKIKIYPTEDKAHRAAQATWWNHLTICKVRISTTNTLTIINEPPPTTITTYIIILLEGQTQKYIRPNSTASINITHAKHCSNRKQAELFLQLTKKLRAKRRTATSFLYIRKLTFTLEA